MSKKYWPKNGISNERIYWHSLVKSSTKFTNEERSILYKIEDSLPRRHQESDSSFPWGVSYAMQVYMIDRYRKEGEKYLQHITSRSETEKKRLQEKKNES
tara:strand:- start:1081 stop:1380 length:300 start_codon:yes stop_codon:yes gene_type:complete